MWYKCIKGLCSFFIFPLKHLETHYKTFFRAEDSLSVSFDGVLQKRGTRKAYNSLAGLYYHDCFIIAIRFTFVLAFMDYFMMYISVLCWSKVHSACRPCHIDWWEYWLDVKAKKCRFCAETDARNHIAHLHRAVQKTGIWYAPGPTKQWEEGIFIII